MQHPIKDHTIIIQRSGSPAKMTLRVTATGVDVDNELPGMGARQWHNNRDDAGNLLCFFRNRPSYIITREVA